MIETVKEMINVLEAKVKEYEEIYGEELQELEPMMASGGNYDDAYSLGYEHGEVYGKLDVLYDLLKELEKYSLDKLLGQITEENRHQEQVTDTQGKELL